MLLITALISFTACSFISPKKEVEQIKTIESSASINTIEPSTSIKTQVSVESSATNKEPALIDISATTKPQEIIEPEITPAYIEIIQESSLKKQSNGAFYIYGKTSGNCSAITIVASNNDSGIHDVYPLKEYKYGDSKFKYGIKKEWKNLGSGLNLYTITAYCDDEQVIEEEVKFNYTPPTPEPIVNNYTKETESILEPLPNPISVSPTIVVPSSSDLFKTIDYLYANEADLITNCDDEYVYLGKIANKYDSKSIFDKYGDYGSKYTSTSIWDKYGDYGSKYSDCSPFDKYASNPPAIVIGDDIVGYLSKNKYAGSYVIDPNDLLLYAYKKFDDDSWLDLVQD